MDTNQIVTELTREAREKWDTTPGDVVNAVKASTLTDEEAIDFAAKALESLPPDHPILIDDDPDEYLGWHMEDGVPVPEGG